MFSSKNKNFKKNSFKW